MTDSSPQPRRPPHPASTPIALVAAMRDLQRDVLTSALATGAHECVILRHSIDDSSGTLQRVISDSTGIIEDITVPLTHACSGCAMREDAVPTLQRLVDMQRWDAIMYALPLAADPMPIAAGLGSADSGRSAVRGAHLGRVVTMIDAHTVHEDVFGDMLVDEIGAAHASDSRSYGEALAAQLEYADIIALHGDQKACESAQNLVGHLVWDDTVRLESDPYALNSCDVFDSVHDTSWAIHRRDPQWVRPGRAAPPAHLDSSHRGGPEVPVDLWTVDLFSERAFHPERFLEFAEELGTGRLRARGRFWIPTRPGTICQWDGAGGAVAIGSVGAPHESAASTGLPTTRLIITGERRSDCDRVIRAFHRILMSHTEWGAGLEPWLGVDDGMDAWLGARGSETTRQNRAA